MRLPALYLSACVTLLTIFVWFPTPGWSQERARLRVSTLFVGSSLLPIWIAQDLGYFSRAGVDVELISMQSSLSATALLAGEVDVIFGTPQVPLSLLSSKNPPNFVAIAAWGSGSEHWLVVNPSIKKNARHEPSQVGGSWISTRHSGEKRSRCETSDIFICGRTSGAGGGRRIGKSDGIYG